MQYSEEQDRTVKYPRKVKYKTGQAGKVLQDSEVQGWAGQAREVLQVIELLQVSEVQERTGQQRDYRQLSTGRPLKYCMTVKYRIGQDKARTMQDSTGQAGDEQQDSNI